MAHRRTIIPPGMEQQYAEWQIAPGGNSGVMFRVSESADATFLTGPEVQVRDPALG